MCYYNSKHFAIFMTVQFGIDINEEQVGEESVLLYKEELDENFVSEELFSISPEMVLIHSCVYNNEEHEWLVCVASDADTNQPLFLVCLKNDEKIYEEVLLRDEDNEK
ncbi:hypothetical protein [Bacillus atrophaeus]|uniref:hypothetical protein n=1 Tax=Bacillus atrophaeus TaxID=1452 RepID=UPI002280FC5A|nr:hypothetical protein [Bacillus atrophaeus]MCY8921154.1 hypothetical protein [Bacillus atrophaeus]MCY9166287.1 hypothetical protein [Bacillus atrophaeus]